MKVMRKIIEIDEEKCNGCGNCVPACAEGAIQIINGKAKVTADKYCDGLGACLGDCPQGALRLIEREADEFDEVAVEEMLNAQKAVGQTAPSGGGCPSAALKIFPTAMPTVNTCQSANTPKTVKSGGPSALGHWPVQIRLVPAGAPFLRGADLLIAADCVPVAYPSFHKDFLHGKAVMIGCPKFDDAQSYVDKLADVFARAGIKSITSVVMEVPCCSSMAGIIKNALAKSKTEIPFKTITVTASGEILS
ncbi:MAG: 4Fe-4S ferredoxin [Desulfobacterales bacterium]|nr:MAG: 4Fe-4S ferredoxin [Desulfobacterales bacterium]